MNLDGSVALGEPEERDSATIGLVEAVSPNTIEITVLREAPHGTGLREGSFQRFPRINSYVVLPSERGSILAMVVWLGIDNVMTSHAEPDRIGLPIARRRLRALPLGVLRRTASLLESGQPTLVLDRGVLLFPTVGDPVRLPTRAEAAAAVPGVLDDRLTVPIGRAPLAGDAPVHVDPNRMFGRHLAVLGNTGSGKSCSVVQLLRSSARAAANEGVAGFRAIVLDLNGEYSRSFDDLADGISVRRFSAMPNDDTAEQLRLPSWLWDYKEWLSFTDASSKSQAPQLRRALHLLRTHEFGNLPRGIIGLVAGRRIVRQYQASAVEADANRDCLSVLDNVLDACDGVAADTDSASAVGALREGLEAVLSSRRGSGGYTWAYTTSLLNNTECNSLLALFNTAITAVGFPEFLEEGFTIDSPVPFNAVHLLELLPLLAADSGPDVGGWVAPLVERLRIALADDRLDAISGWVGDETIGAWLTRYLADGQASQVTVLDLSLVPSNVLHLVTAVFARLLIEALERHRRHDAEQQVPIVLVVEEAHALIRRHVASVDDDQAIPMVRLCREAFERIAREGRKFGLSLVVSSQRPSELSETVLSQCNTFLIHRIVNDHDQALVRRMVPDSLAALTEELPALPSQTALLLGWAVDVPTLVRVDDLAEEYRPRSADPDFASAWTGIRHGTADWEAIATDWLSGTRAPDVVPPPTENTPSDDSPF